MATLSTPVRARGASGLSAYWLAWLASITFFAGFYALLVPLPRYLAAMGLPDAQIGFVLGAFGIASLLGRPLSGAVVDRFGARPIMLVGAASLAAGALGVSATHRFGVLIFLRVLQALGYVAFTTAGTALVVSLTAPERRAGRLATFGAAANVAIALAPAAVSALLEVAPLQAGFSRQPWWRLWRGCSRSTCPRRRTGTGPRSPSAYRPRRGVSGCQCS